MNPWLQRLAFRWLARKETVPVANCVHFAGFRYGCGEPNPYEGYLVAVASGRDKNQARAEFTDLLQHFRPKHLGEALGATLNRQYPLWHYPWSRGAPAAVRPGWLDNPAEVPDIITFFSERGILRSRIEEEFGWLEDCLESIRRHGYQPARFAGEPRVRRLLAADGQVRFVVHDGNHRLAALAALGVTEVSVRYSPLMTVFESELPHWPGVKSQFFTLDDARRVFLAYFTEKRNFRTTPHPAPIIPS